MRKRQLVVATVMLVVSAATYGLAQMLEASPAVVESIAAIERPVAAAAPALAWFDDAPALPFSALPDPLSDASLLLVTGATLLVVAAGLRRTTDPRA